MSRPLVTRLAVLLMDLGALDHFGDAKWEMDPVRLDAYARGLRRDEQERARPDSLSVYERFVEDEVLRAMNAPVTAEHRRRVRAEYEWTFASNEEREERIERSSNVIDFAAAADRAKARRRRRHTGPSTGARERA